MRNQADLHAGNSQIQFINSLICSYLIG